MANLSHFLSSDFVYFVITITKKKSKEHTIVETKLRIKKDDYDT